MRLVLAAPVCVAAVAGFFPDDTSEAHARSICGSRRFRRSCILAKLHADGVIEPSALENRAVPCAIAKGLSERTQGVALHLGRYFTGRVTDSCSSSFLSMSCLCAPNLQTDRRCWPYTPFSTRPKTGQGSSVTGYLSRADLAYTRGMAGDANECEKGRLAVGMVTAVVGERGLLVPAVLNGATVMRFRVHSESGSVDDKDHTALGRAISLAIRYGKDMRELGLARDLALWLHPRIFGRISWEEAKRTEQALGMGMRHPRHLIRAVHSVSRGIAEGMGLGGFALISDSDWASLFGVSE